MPEKDKKIAANRSGNHTLAARVAQYGVLIALAMICSYVEALIPINLGIPGIKLGLANLVVFIALYRMRPVDAFAISIVRIILVGFTFGSMATMMYSMAGGMLSFFLMWLCKKKEWLERTGVSIVGGVSHNLGQLIVAAFVVENAAVFSYFPVLLLSGTIMGAIIGMIGALIIVRLPRNL